MRELFNKMTTEQSISYVETCTDEEFTTYTRYFNKRVSTLRLPASNELPTHFQLIKDAIESRS